MGLFKTNWSKWQPITIYTVSFEDFLLLGRINTKNGDVKFKSKKIHGMKLYKQAYHLFDKPLNANEQLLNLFYGAKHVI